MLSLPFFSSLISYLLLWVRFSYLCTRSLVAVILFFLGGLASVVCGCLSSRTSASTFAGLLSWFPWRKLDTYHPREHLPPPGLVLPVPLLPHWLSYRSLCIYVLSLDHRPASFGASLLRARPSPISCLQFGGLGDGLMV